MTTATAPRCPICKEPVKGSRENSWFPFCSNRCKLVDLSKWLNNEYTIPTDNDDESESPPGPNGEQLH